jgi:protein-S-isoprenylcysteine O-methyltransferase Ste14
MTETQSNTTFRIIFFTLFFLVLVIRGYYGWKQRQAGQRSGAVTREAIEREGMWSIVLRFILFLYMVAVAIVFAINPPWLNLFAAPFPAWSRWMGVGLALVSASWLILILVVAAILVLYARIGKEEAMMIVQFGDEYRAYMQCTGRLLPHW